MAHLEGNDKRRYTVGVDDGLSDLVSKVKSSAAYLLQTGPCGVQLKDNKISIKPQSKVIHNTPSVHAATQS